MDKVSTIYQKVSWNYDQEWLRLAEANLERIVDIQEKAWKNLQVLKTYPSFADLLADTPAAVPQLARPEVNWGNVALHGPIVPFPAEAAPATFANPYSFDTSITGIPAWSPAYAPTTWLGESPAIVTSARFQRQAALVADISRNIDEQLRYSDVFSKYGFLPVELLQQDRATQIREELYNLKAQLANNELSHGYLLMEVRSLTTELYQLMHNGVRKYKRMLKSSRKKLKIKSKTDLPRKNREAVVFILFKIFNDFSGSEEEEADDQQFNADHPSFSKIQKSHYYGTTKQRSGNTRPVHFRQAKRPIQQAA